MSTATKLTVVDMSPTRHYSSSLHLYSGNTHVWSNNGKDQLAQCMIAILGKVKQFQNAELETLHISSPPENPTPQQIQEVRMLQDDMSVLSLPDAKAEFERNAFKFEEMDLPQLSAPSQSRRMLQFSLLSAPLVVGSPPVHLYVNGKSLWIDDPQEAQSIVSLLAVLTRILPHIKATLVQVAFEMDEPSRPLPVIDQWIEDASSKTLGDALYQLKGLSEYGIKHSITCENL